MSRRAGAVDGMVGPRMAPVCDALLHVRCHLPDPRGTDDEEYEADGDEGDAPGGDEEHREEDPEVQEPAAEITRLQQDEDRHPPDHEQRPEVLRPALREHLAL